MNKIITSIQSKINRLRAIGWSLSDTINSMTIMIMFGILTGNHLMTLLGLIILWPSLAISICDRFDAPSVTGSMHRRAASKPATKAVSRSKARK